MVHGERKRVFISYAHEDVKWRDAFTQMLVPACERGIVKVWSDDLIPVCEKWADQIESALDRASIGLLLVTPKFFESKYISEVELKRLLKAAAARAVSIHWVPISASLFEYSNLGSLQPCWNPEAPLDGLSEPELTKAIKKICLGIVDKFSVAKPISKDRRERLREQVQRHLGTKYVIKEEIQSGKFSILYRAEREQPKQTVAVKVFTASELDEWARKEFTECVERAVNLRSAAFIRIFDCAMSKSPEYLILELVDGEQLNDYLRRYPEGLPLASVKTILLDLAIGIEEIHALGWRRGEMVPSDVLIQPSGAPRLSPVNFSNVEREQLQLTGNFFVDRKSLSYMTPERFYGDQATAATDQYSLGLLATELLSGEPIKRVMHPCDLGFKERLYSDLESGRWRFAERSPEFAGLLRRMLRINPEERWPSMTEVVVHLRDIEVAESAQEKNRKKATSGYLQILAARGVKDEREFFNRFYRNPFSSAEGIEAKFQTLDMERQYRMLDGAIYWLLKFRADSSTAKKQLEQLAQRHQHLGLEPRHFELFLEAFMRTLADEETHRQNLDAWRVTLTGGIEVMAARATAKASMASDCITRTVLQSYPTAPSIAISNRLAREARRAPRSRKKGGNLSKIKSA